MKDLDLPGPGNDGRPSSRRHGVTARRRIEGASRSLTITIGRPGRSGALVPGRAAGLDPAATELDKSARIPAAKGKNSWPSGPGSGVRRDSAARPGFFVEATAIRPYNRGEPGAHREAAARRKPMTEAESEGSITRCIRLLRRGDRDAAQLIWQRYMQRLVGLARARLRNVPSRAVDEEDVALSAFDSFFRRAERGQFARLEDRDDLWQLLFVLTVRKAADLARREGRVRRGGGAVLILSELEGMGADEVLGREPAPDLAAQMDEECRRLLHLLGDDALRHVALRKLEGYTNAEIAGEVGCVEKTVERKLQRIRRLWSKGQVGPSGRVPGPA